MKPIQANPTLDEASFTQALRDTGFEEVTKVQRPANARLGTHTHSFEAHALILSGEIRIQCEGEGEIPYRAGDVFHLARETPHTEAYGPQGVSYLVGRK